MDELLSDAVLDGETALLADGRELPVDELLSDAVRDGETVLVALLDALLVADAVAEAEDVLEELAVVVAVSSS